MALNSTDVSMCPVGGRETAGPKWRSGVKNTAEKGSWRQHRALLKETRTGKTTDWRTRWWKGDLSHAYIDWQTDACMWTHGCTDAQMHGCTDGFQNCVYVYIKNMYRYFWQKLRNCCSWSDGYELLQVDASVMWHGNSEMKHL